MKIVRHFLGPWGYVAPETSRRLAHDQFHELCVCVCEPKRPTLPVWNAFLVFFFCQDFLIMLILMGQHMSRDVVWLPLVLFALGKLHLRREQAG